MADQGRLRRADFLPGASVVLADGGAWTFPDPGDPSLLGPEGQALLAAIAESEDESGRLAAELALAIFLLGRNYHLRPADYRALLSVPEGGPRLAAIQAAIAGVAARHLQALSAAAGAEIVDPKGSGESHPGGLFALGSS